MENSEMYKFLKEILSSNDPRIRMGGYFKDLLEGIYDWEREEVEDIIWKEFFEGHNYSMTHYFPKLKKYPGISKLKEILPTCNMPSDVGLDIAIILYNIEGDKKYLNIIEKSIKLDPDDLWKISSLLDCKPNDRIYQLFVDRYLNSADDTIRYVAVTGILYNKGIIKDPKDYLNVPIEISNIRKKFRSENREERKKLIRQFEKGELI